MQEEQAAAPVRVFISYAHDDPAHEERVREFWLFLHRNGIDAHADLTAQEQRQDWTQWMTREIRSARHVLVIASPQYRRRAEGDAAPDEGRGVQWEAGIVQELIYADQQAALQRVLPVVLPGCSADDFPQWLRPASTTHYVVSDYTVGGAERLLRLLTGQPWETDPDTGAVPFLPPRGAGTLPAATGTPALRTDVLVEARVADDGELTSSVWLAGSPLCHRAAPLPAEVARVWSELALPAPVAAERMAVAGRKLAGALMDEASQRLIGDLLHQLRPGEQAGFVLEAPGPALALPVELIRLTTSAGTEAGPLALLPAVNVSRRLAARPGAEAAVRPQVGLALPGPLKILAAVAAPDESKTRNEPFDAEAAMQALLDAVAGVAGHPSAQVRVLEVASLPAIRQALADDPYHVLHLHAHGSATSVELEDEDGAPAEVASGSLMDALRMAGHPVPLIVLSSCSGGATGSQAMAASLIAQGADNVIAFLAPVTDDYATHLARTFYRELSSHPALPVGQALARARYLTQEERAKAAGKRLPLPEYGLATLLTAGADAPLVDPTAPAQPLWLYTVPPSGTSVRELSMGALIGRRAELRTAMRVLRRVPEAVRQHGAASGVQVLGIGGIGKTALAGRVMSRLRADGWLIAVHDGRWNPTALIDATAAAIRAAPSRTDGTPTDGGLADVLSFLTAPGDDTFKLAAVAGLLVTHRVLLVFDDFEQNLTPGGQDFLDPAIGEVITSLADAAETGALLLTSRYRLPGPDRFLAGLPLPPLSAAELRRMFLRLPALNDLDTDDRLLLTRAIGGHPRLIEFVDALLRGGKANLKQVQAKLRDLAHAEGIDLRQDRRLQDAVDQAMLVGSADILLTELLALLTPQQAAILDQVAVSRAPMTPDDLGFALTADPDQAVPATATGQLDPTTLRADTDRLIDLTLLIPGDEIAMHPWTADLITRNAGDLSLQHARALTMRMRRLDEQRGSYDDLVDIPRHLAHLRRYDDLANFADETVQELPGILATVAYLAEIRPLIPPTERAWILVAWQEANALLTAGDLPSAGRMLQAAHPRVATRAAADPANTGWQRDLSVSHEKLGDLAVTAGDLATADTAYQAA
ncbi:MAG TPA: CHAT domain-containing protein, partial [Streptosporangiaceae bacterium]|nr:CHAT domain-containing protein [Streptosporangiaceae bacterium]